MQPIVPHKLRVLFVIDDHKLNPDSSASELQHSRVQAVEDFWNIAARLCPDHPTYQADKPCPNCPFDLTFCAWFPEALFRIVNGQEFDVYIIDIHANAHPRNRCDDAAYVEQLSSLDDVVPVPLNHTVNGTDVIKNIRSAHRPVQPMIVYFSSQTKFHQYPEMNLYCSNIHGGRPEDLQNVLLLAQGRLRGLLEGAFASSFGKVFLTDERTPAVHIHFNGEGTDRVRLHVAPGMTIGVNESERLTTPKTALAKTSRGGDQKVKFLRRCIRMAGQPIRFSQRFTVSNAMRLDKKKSDPHGAVLDWLDKRLPSEGDDGISWHAHPEIETSVELAWAHLYSGILLIAAVAKQRLGESPIVRDALSSVAEGKLITEVELLNPMPRTLEVARKCFDRAADEGFDISMDDEFPDLEMAIMPQIGRLCCELLDGDVCSDLDTVALQRCNNIYDVIAAMLKFPPTYGKAAWLWSMKAWLALFAESGLNGERIVAELIRSYGSGNSAYWEAYRHFERLTGLR